MRMVRTAAKALAAIVLLPGMLTAQEAAAPAHKFNDSWFWGLHSGAMLFSAGANNETQITAPTVGVEWFITRTRLALRVGIDQAFFDEQAGVVDPTMGGAVRPVDVTDWRRYAAEVYFLTSTESNFRPYAGLGVALNVLQESVPTGTFTSPEAMDTVVTEVHELSSRASFVVTGGAQMGFGRTAAFLQASAMPTRNGFLLSRSQYTIVFSAGLRYNFGSAIEKF